MASATLRPGGIVVTGGQSRRMGQPKAWLRCGGEHLLSRVVSLVSRAADPVVVAARPGQSLPPLAPAVEVAFDAPEHSGPLAGIAAGFGVLAGRCEATFVVACDHPVLRPGFLDRLAELLGDYEAVIVRHGGHLHPLAALYRLSTRNLLDETLRLSILRATTFAQRCRARIVQASDFADCDPRLDSLRSFNDPPGYDELLPPIPG